MAWAVVAGAEVGVETQMVVEEVGVGTQVPQVAVAGVGDKIGVGVQKVEAAGDTGHWGSHRRAEALARAWCSTAGHIAAV